MSVSIIVTFRSASEECAKNPESQTKWVPFDIIELREASATVNGQTPASEPPNYSEKEDGEVVPEKNV